MFYFSYREALRKGATAARLVRFILSHRVLVKNGTSELKLLSVTNNSPGSRSADTGNVGAAVLAHVVVRNRLFDLSLNIPLN